MARGRKLDPAKAAVVKTNPGRTKDRKVVSGGAPLGDPPKYFTDARREVWEEIKERCPLELTEADFMLVERLAYLVEQQRKDIAMRATDANQLRQYLGELHMTPQSRGASGGGRQSKDNDELGAFRGISRPE